MAASFSELGESLQAVIEKITEFVDLSFLPAGAACLFALLFWNHRAGFVSDGIPAGWEIIAGGLASYVLGLVCFATGRRLRKRLFRGVRKQSFDGAFRAELHKHDLDAPSLPYAAYLAHDQTNALYTLLWAEARQVRRLAPSFSLLRRYWTLCATFDGVAAALLVWCLACAYFTVQARHDLKSLIAGIALGFLCFVLSYLCMSEANRFYVYQMEELVATIAYRRQTRPAPAISQ